MHLSQLSTRSSKPDNGTPRRGLVKGLICATLMTLFLSALFCALEWFKPGSTIIRQYELSPRATAGSVILSFAVGLLVTRVLFATIHQASGMVGSYAFIVAMLAVVVLSLKHIVLAITGVQLVSGFSKGWVWVYPQTILLRNYSAWIGIGLGVYFFKDGSSLRDWFGRK